MMFRALLVVTLVALSQVIAVGKTEIPSVLKIPYYEDIVASLKKNPQKLEATKQWYENSQSFKAEILQQAHGKNEEQLEYWLSTAPIQARIQKIREDFKVLAFEEENAPYGLQVHLGELLAEASGGSSTDKPIQSLVTFFENELTQKIAAQQWYENYVRINIDILQASRVKSEEELKDWLSTDSMKARIRKIQEEFEGLKFKQREVLSERDAKLGEPLSN